MKSAGRLILILGIVVGVSGCEEEEQQKNQKVRGPAVAGLFYKRHSEDLTKQIDEFLEKAKPEPIKRLRGLVCPHAGYEYSGPTAAFGYKLLKGRQIGTVIVMAPSHYAAFKGASIPDVEAYETPLGVIPLSPKATELAKVKPLAVNPSCEVSRPAWWRQSPKELPPFGKDTPHSWEHSLEVQLPFLQRTLKGFSLVPIVFGQEVDPQAVARGLVKYVDDNTLLVASSDLSHYLPYDTAKGLDTTCCKAICSLNTEWMEQQQACGKGPILALMHLARQKGWKAKLLDYRNSGDTTGDKSRGVVGYAAIAFYEPDGAAGDQQTPQRTGKNEFTPEQRKFLLDLARETVTAVVSREQGKLPAWSTEGVAEKFTDPRACFVTLKKDGELRGCIGNIFPQRPLYQAVVYSAASAAVRDPRFPPVRADELAQIEIEVSVLTLPQRLEFKSPEELLEKLRPQVDGVVLRVGQKQATYLPQVWEDLSDKTTFLNRLAKKAGLSQSDWKSDEATILVYQAEAFKESEM